MRYLSRKKTLVLKKSSYKSRNVFVRKRKKKYRNEYINAQANRSTCIYKIEEIRYDHSISSMTSTPDQQQKQNLVTKQIKC